MEAVPKLHMLWFPLKSSPDGTSFANLKKYIAECYQEDPETYSKEIHALETLRNSSMRPAKDVAGCATLKRYYCQLHAIANRFPQASEKNSFTFTWKDLYVTSVTEISDLRFEMAAVLFNIASFHTQSGASVSRVDADGMKLACTHFQCAAWAFGELKAKYKGINNNTDFMTPELLLFMQQISFAQAQECILEKSLIDNRKPAIVAKVTAQIMEYYASAFAALLTGGEDGSVSEVIGGSVLKEWKRYVSFKTVYLNAILHLYQGLTFEEQQKMGERVTLYQAAFDRLELARKESKGMAEQKEIIDALTFTGDIIEGKLKSAKSENEFIYHEAVPELSDIAAVQGANLVNGISFSVTDPDVAGKDIFARLVPMKAHEYSSVYSEKKDEILRAYATKCAEYDVELEKYLGALNPEFLALDTSKFAVKLPQGIVDRCAALNAKKNAIPDLIASMSNLAEICADVETNLKEIKELLTEEETRENQYQQASGVHRSNAHFTELSREFHKYLEAHQKAGDSNDTLRRAMELHVNNLRILAKPLQEILSSVPKNDQELNVGALSIQVLENMVRKVDEMRAQRGNLLEELKQEFQKDDITRKIIARLEDKSIDDLYEKELQKHDKLITTIDLNFKAQPNILKALTDAYAKCAPNMKILMEGKHKRENFFTSLATSYDVYEDLLAKSAKGLEFYKKLQGNVQKLLARVRAAHDVQDEERTQRLKSIQPPQPVEKNIYSIPTSSSSGSSSQPKLKDYLKSGKSITGGSSFSTESTYIPPIRPNPLGSEAPTTSDSLTSVPPVYQSQYLPSDPPPPYSLQSQNPDISGYTNPIYQTNSIYDQTTKLEASYSYPSYDQQQAAAYQSQYQQSQTQALQSYQNQLAYQALQSAANTAPQSNQINNQQSNHYQYASNFNQYPSSTDQYSSMSLHQQTQATQPYQYQQSSQYSNQYDAHNSQANIQQMTIQQQQVLNAPQPAPSPAPSNASDTSAVSAHNASTLSGYMENMSLQNTTGGQNPTLYYQIQKHQQYDPQASYPYQEQISSNNSASMQGHNFHQSNNIQQVTSLPSTAPTQPNSNYSQQVSAQQPEMGTASIPQSITGISQSMNLQQQYQMNSMPIEIPQQQITGIQQSSDLTVQQANMQLAGNTQAVPSNVVSSSQQASYSTHPGYIFNQMTGQYEYASGYQFDSNQPQQSGYTQYTNSAPVISNQTTDSSHLNSSGDTFANQYSLQQNLELQIAQQQLLQQQQQQQLQQQQHPVQQQPQQQTIQQQSQELQQQPQSTENTSQAYIVGPSYYTAPYGYLPTGVATQAVSNSINTMPTVDGVINTNAHMGNGVTYMQSNNYNSTNTAVYDGNANSCTTTQSSIQQPNKDITTSTNNQKQIQSQADAPSTVPPAKQAPVKKSSNIDLLSDIDFSIPVSSISTPPLQPVIASTSCESLQAVSATPPLVPQQTTIKPKVETIKTADTPQQIDNQVYKSPEKKIPQEISANAVSERKSSCDNLSLCSDLSSLDQNFDWDSVSVRNEQVLPQRMTGPVSESFIKPSRDPFEDQKVLKYFHKEVERFEKAVESLNIKMLNGNTPLVNKWKDLQDLLVKDETKRSSAIAKLFPEKNRTPDCIPYDHARVVLDRSTDNYINAAYIKDLGTGCPTFILAQTPLQNTVNDFWSMIWSQKARTVVCLHTPNEILDPFWPQDMNKEMHFDDFSVTLIKQFDLSHCIELNLKLTMNGADAILDLSLIQIKSWTKNSPAHILGIAQNILVAHKQRSQEFKSNAPLIMNCLTGSERSGLIALAICTILATQTRRPVLINVVDVWYRICSQRKGGLRDANNLELSMQIVLSYGHDILNKRGILTSYQMKNVQTTTKTEIEEVKDPLNDLDPLWKLKSK